MIPGEPWILKDKDATSITCCDCGLEHFLLVDIKGKKVTLRHYRDTYETKKNRKKNRIVVYRREVAEKEDK